jgi:hypothetical protein
MATPQQTAANRANAQHSTGPRTEAGKAASSQNARKHGLSSQHLPLSPEERPLFEQLEADLRSQVNPSGALQESIFIELVAAAWKRNIVNRLLAEAVASTEALFAEEVPDRVRKLLRHKADQDRAFNRSLRQLQELQTAAQRREPGEAPTLARPITKRTQFPPLHQEEQAKPARPIDPIFAQNFPKSGAA